MVPLPKIEEKECPRGRCNEQASNNEKSKTPTHLSSAFPSLDLFNKTQKKLNQNFRPRQPHRRAHRLRGLFGAAHGDQEREFRKRERDRKKSTLSFVPLSCTLDESLKRKNPKKQKKRNPLKIPSLSHLRTPSSRSARAPRREATRRRGCAS